MDTPLENWPEARAGGPESLNRTLEDWIWLGRLCARLVTDPGLADDARQEAWISGTNRHSMFLSARRFIWRTRRSEARRARRESIVAKAEALPSTEELVLRAEQQSRVKDQLLELEEPYRTALLLRYQEGLEPKEIADREGIPADTVRWRLRKGLERLRARLTADDEGGGLQAVMLGVPLGLLGAPGAPAAATASTTLLKTGAATKPGAWFSTAIALLMLKQAVVLGSVALLSIGLHTALSGGSTLDLPLADAPIVLMEDDTASELDAVKNAPALAENRMPLIAPAGAEPQASQGTKVAAAAAMSRVTGRVVERKGLPIAGALVTVTSLDRDTGGEPVEATSDMTGAFEIQLPEDRSGRYRVEVRASEFLTKASRRMGPGGSNGEADVLLLPAGATSPTDLGEIVLDDACVLIGRVVDEQGRGVADASARTGRSNVAPRSAADGSFRIPHTPVSDDRLFLGAPGRRPATQPFQAIAGATIDLGTIQLGSGYVVSGVVIDEESRPVANARVREMGGAEALTDREGRFELLATTDKGISIHARKANIGAAQGKLQPSAYSDVVLRLAAYAPMATFKVIDRETGDPVLVYGFLAESRGLMRGARNPNPRPEARAYESEVFKARCRPKDDRIYVAAPGYRSASFRVRNSAFDGTQVLKLRRPNLVVGRVVRDGSPAPFAEVKMLTGRGLKLVEAGAQENASALPSGGRQRTVARSTGDPLPGSMGPLTAVRGAITSVLADENGEFELPITKEGERSLIASAEGITSSVLHVEKTKRGRTDVGTLELRQGPPLKGRVEWSGSAPLRGHKVQIEGLLAQHAITDDQGLFSMENVPEGDLLLRVMPGEGITLPPGASIERFHVAHSSERSRDIVLEMEAAATLEVTVQLTLNGEPAAGMRLILKDLDANMSGPGVMLDTSGTAVCEAPMGRPFTAELAGRGGSLTSPVPLLVSPGETELTLAFEAGSLEIQLPESIERSSFMTASLKGTLNHEGQQRTFKNYQRQVAENADGRLVFRFGLVPVGLQAASVLIGASENEFQPEKLLEQSIDASLKPGETVILSL